MARVSIYVSDELKARMTEAGDALNWSDIARPAFETALASHNHRKGQNMQTAIERLRASKAQHESEEKGGGERVGREWALHHAGYRDLKRLSLIDTTDYEHAPDDIWGAIREAIDPDEELYESELIVRLFNDDVPPAGGWLCAWVVGAQAVFSEIEDKL